MRKQVVPPPPVNAEERNLVLEIAAAIDSSPAARYNSSGNLYHLHFYERKVAEFHPAICQFSHLEWLSFAGTSLKVLPADIASLKSLRHLDLSGTQIRVLPPEIGSLTDLAYLDLSETPIERLPLSLGRLLLLSNIELYNSERLQFPPPEIVARGTLGIKHFLKELSNEKEGGKPRYEAKIVFVGEGRTGKSSVLAALRGEKFDPNRDSTHGIEVDRLYATHPEHPGKRMTLNTWDFGGQQIYHATHQFFLTERTLYVVVWNAGMDVTQSNIDNWLKTIHALAPQAPVLLVATHTDQRSPDINYSALKKQYPQLEANLSVSNKTGDGIEDLKKLLRKNAVGLPLMGQPWPQSWDETEQSLLRLDHHHIDSEYYSRICSLSGVSDDVARGELGGVLHDLGKILYFRNDELLSNLVVLKPNWITKAISRVLTDEHTRDTRGVLLHSELDRIWSQDDEGRRYARHLFPVFLRLMEKFELSYQIEPEIEGEKVSRSLVPQLLPHQQPLALPQPPVSTDENSAHVAMVYKLNFVPAGVMSRFIVRVVVLSKLLIV